MSLITSLLERLSGKRTAQSRWDERWADPAFYGAYRLDELAHYSVLAGYAKALKPDGSVLDVGCGDGILRAHLHDSFSKYVGVDFPQAIDRAAKRADARTSFVASDLRAFTTDGRFDVIVFNESLYYVEDAIAELDRYSGFLVPGGVFLVSMHRKPKSEKIWGDIGSRFEMIDRVVIGNRNGVEWIAGAFGRSGG
jgi:2-polyprenyl-3-methyl-5-hydroxy-6-metoxy-1,4-benzoquinol methylase